MAIYSNCSTNLKQELEGRFQLRSHQDGSAQRQHIM